MTRAFVTGGAGFIGSNLVDRLLSLGQTVTAFDNLSTGRAEFLAEAETKPGFAFVKGDVLDPDRLRQAMAGHDIVYHLAANADVRFGMDHPDKDLHQNTLATFQVLEAMRATGARRIAFSSTGSVYGEPEIFPTPEDAPFPVQTSLYAVSKIAAEGLISAYCTALGWNGLVFRFVSVLGERYTHGHIFDFYRKLCGDPARLHVLGDGHQKKSYMYVQDCIDGVLTAVEKCPEGFNVFNLGLDDTAEVNDSIAWITGHLGLAPRLTYEGGKRGWIGDSPLIHLDVSRIRALGWHPNVAIRDGVIRTLEWLKANAWVFDARENSP